MANTMNDPQVLYESIQQLGAQTDLAQGSSKIGLKTDWTDEKFKELTSGMDLKYESDEASVQALIKGWIHKFYSASQGKYNTYQYLRNAVCLTPYLQSSSLTGKDIAEGEFKRELIQCLQELEKIGPPTVGDGNKDDIGEDAEELRKLAESGSSMVQNININQASQYQGPEEILKLLLDLPKNELLLRCIVSYQAIVCCRMVVKSADTVADYFENRFNSTLRSLHPSLQFDFMVGSPHKEFLRKVQTDIGSTQEDSRKLVKSILRTYYDAVVAKNEAKTAISPLETFLYAGCLLHWRGNGMGAIGLTITMQETKNKTMLDIIDACGVQEMLRSLKTIAGYCARYLPIVDEGKTTQKAITWWWARLIDPEYFSDASVNSNLVYCFVMAYWLQDVQPNILDKTGLKNLDSQSRKIWEQYARTAAPKWLKANVSKAFGKVAMETVASMQSASMAGAIKNPSLFEQLGNF